MTWDQQRRDAYAERMRGINPVTYKQTKGRLNSIPVEDRQLIRALIDERDKIKAQLATEEAIWAERRAKLRAQIVGLTNAKIGEKFGVSDNQVHQIANGTAGQLL